MPVARAPVDPAGVFARGLRNGCSDLWPSIEFLLPEQWIGA
jgi:hypothetical protein